MVLTQRQGVHFELRLLDAADDGAKYQISLLANERKWQGELELLAPTGEVRFQFADGDSPPEWCLGIARATARSIYRERANNGFPRRVNRWRPSPQVDTRGPE